MAGSIVGTLKVLLTANIAEFQTAMGRASNTAKDWEKTLKSTGRQATELGAALTKTLTVPLAGLGVVSSKLAIDFESSFAGIVKTVDDATDEFGNLTDAGRALQQGMRDLAKTIPINVNELNRIGEAAGQLGIKTEKILSFTETMAKLGVTTSLSAEEAAVSLAQLANITQMPQTEFDKLGSTIVHLGNNLATNESKIVDFGLRIAAAGELAGMSEHQILSIGAAMASVGVEAEAGGTAVQKVLNGMTEAVAVGGKHLEIFAATAGLSAQQFKDAWKQDAAGAFNEFVKGLAREGDNAFKILDGLGLGNERVIRSFLSLANAGDTLTRSLALGADGWRENSALTDEARKRFETTEAKLTLLWNRLKDVGITFGNALKPAIELAIGALDKLIPVLEAAANWFNAMPAGLQLVVVGLGALVAAAGPVIYIFGQLALSAAAVTGAFGRQAAASGVLGTALRGLGASMMALGPLAASLATAFAGWKLGEFARDLGGVEVKVGDVSRAVEQLGFRALTAGEKVEFLAVRLSNWEVSNEDIVRSIITSRDQFRLMGESAEQSSIDIVRGAQRSVPAQREVQSATTAVAQATADWDRILGQSNTTSAIAADRSRDLAAAFRDISRAIDDSYIRALTFNELLGTMAVRLGTPPPPDFFGGVSDDLSGVLEGFEGVEMGQHELEATVTSSWTGIGDMISRTLGGMLTKAISLKDGLISIFHQVASAFIDNLLNRMLNGTKQTLGQMSGMFQGFFGGLMGVLSGGLAGLAVGGIQALGGWIAGLFGNDTKDARAQFAQSLGFGNVDALFDRLNKISEQTGDTKGWTLVDQALNLIGRNDRAANEAWMHEVIRLLEEAGEAADETGEKFEAIPDKAKRAADDVAGAFEDLTRDISGFSFDIPITWDIDTPDFSKALGGVTGFRVPSSESGIPGFATGSEWRDFGVGSLAMLHGLERVQTPAMAMAERASIVQSVRGGDGAAAPVFNLHATIHAVDSDGITRFVRSGAFGREFTARLRDDPDFRRWTNRGLD